MKYLINVISHIGCTIVGKTEKQIKDILYKDLKRIEELYEIYIMLSNTEEAEKYRRADMIQSYVYFEESASNLFETYKKNNNV
jgi:hypothetical protein